MLLNLVLKKTLESPLDSKEIKPVNPKGNQSWIFIGRTDAEAPVLWPPDVKNCLIGKGPDAGKDWRWEEKGTTEDEMVGWQHQLNVYEFEQAPGVGDGQGSLASMGLHRVGPNWSDSAAAVANESTLCIRWLKYCSFSISPSNEYSGLISFRIDWFDLLAVQGTLKSLL